MGKYDNWEELLQGGLELAKQTGKKALDLGKESIVDGATSAVGPIASPFIAAASAAEDTEWRQPLPDALSQWKNKTLQMIPETDAGVIEVADRSPIASVAGPAVAGLLGARGLRAGKDMTLVERAKRAALENVERMRSKRAMGPELEPTPAQAEAYWTTKRQPQIDMAKPARLPEAGDAVADLPKAESVGASPRAAARRKSRGPVEEDGPMEWQKDPEAPATSAEKQALMKALLKLRGKKR